jgi:geranylgeranyl pyrophosphate synthase
VGLLDRASGPDRDRLTAVFGYADATDADIRFVRNLADRLGVREDARQVMSRLGRRAGEEILALPVGEGHREILLSLLEYSLNRRS